MAKRQLPSPEVLRQLLTYDPETGKLFWKERARGWFGSDRHCNAWNARFSGAEAFTAINSRGYKTGGIFGKIYQSHRIAWAIHFGLWPRLEIDHINGQKTDNRLENLRVATHQENCFNRPTPPSNKSGYKGVYWCGQMRQWRASIRCGEVKDLGHFPTPQEAHEAYRAAAKKFHGDFARTA